ncbi:MAG: Na+ antiporter [Armatimonadetes bacterium]|jgi:CPA1 family monovalent cation:H+ antiporter|nr:Na+ antiporter [Armatimonadota bacterium]
MHDGIDITPFIWLLVAASVVSMLARRIRVPYSLALVVTGLLLGAPHLLPGAHLEPHTLFTVFLPPLLFESAINLRIDALRRDWRPIALFALGGTVLSTVVVGGLTAWLLRVPLPVALVFGAIISPTDPISVIALFKRLGVGRRLALLVEGESLLNDGVAVVIFGVLVEAVSRNTPIDGLDSLRQFFTVVAGGAGVGFGIGLLMSRVTRYFDDHLLEIMLTFIVAFGSYLAAEGVHVSGVIAVVTAGLVIGNYGMETGMSPGTRLAVSAYWEYAAFAANSIVFLLVGLEVSYFRLWEKVLPISAAVGIVLAGRAISIYVLSYFGKHVGAKVPARWQHVLFWGGLRGALSMALVLGLARSFPYRDLLVTLTFGVVLFSLLAQGLTMEPLLKLLRVTEPKREAEYQRLSGSLYGIRAALAEVQRLRANGLVPPQVCEPVEADFRARIQDAEKAVEELHLNNEALFACQVADVRQRALAAEKSALQDAARSGLIDADDLRELEENLDAELAELQSQDEQH